MTKNKELPSQEFLIANYSYDPSTGEFTNRHKFFRPKLYSENKYQRLAINKIDYQVHRLIWKYMTGETPELIDHKDGNKSNNKWDNLRNVIHKINSRNKKKQSNNTSGYTGVSFNSVTNKWQASVAMGYRTFNLGQFNCPTAGHFSRAKFLKNNPQCGFTERHGT